MKKSLLIACACAGLLTQSVLAQISLTATPSSQNVAAGGSFDVTIHLSVTGTTPADADGFNLWLETAIANSGLFTVSSVTNLVNWTTAAGGTISNDEITGTGTTHSGFAQNTFSLGFVDSSPTSANKVSTPITDLSLETIHLVASGTSGTPNPGTYTFFITNATTSSPRSSGINDSNGNFFNADNTGSFQITIIPEPATWSLLGLGGLGSFGMTWLRARRRS